MSAVLYAARFRCDLCGAEGDSLPPAGDGAPGEIPAGWTYVESLARRNGMWASHFCDSCSRLPFGEVIERINNADT